MPTVATIGVYGFSAEQFGAALWDEGVALLIDVRQRRGVRGTEYAVSRLDPTCSMRWRPC